MLWWWYCACKLVVMIKSGNVERQWSMILSPEPLHTVSYMHDSLRWEDWQSTPWYHVLDNSSLLLARTSWDTYTTNHIQVSVFPFLPFRDRCLVEIIEKVSFFLAGVWYFSVLLIQEWTFIFNHRMNSVVRKILFFKTSKMIFADLT